MVLKMFDFIVAEGNPIELALYTHTILEIFKTKYEIDMKEKDNDFLDKIRTMSFEDLLKTELSDEVNDKNEDSEGD